MTDNVTPIAPTDPPCASCGAVLRVGDRFDPEKHDERCRQPEIRMRRVEGELAELKNILFQLVGQGNETVTNQVDLNNRLIALNDVVKAQGDAVQKRAEAGSSTLALVENLVQRVARMEEQQAFLWRRTLQVLGVTDPMSLKEAFENGSSEAIPDTQRSGDTFRRHCGDHAGWRSDCERCAATDRAPELHPDASPAESAGAPDAGADAAARGPAGAEPGS